MPLGLADASRSWRRRFTRVARTHPGANTVFKLAERRPGGEESYSYLKLYGRPGPSVAEMDFELRVLRTVRPDPEIAVASPLAGRNGRLRFRLPWDGTIRHACLFTAAPGRELLPRVEDVRRFGRGLALLHDALAEVRIVPRRRLEADVTCRTAIRWLRRAGPDATRIADDIELAVPALAAALVAVKPRIGLCHGDARLANAALDGERLTFFDFEDCAVAPLMIDLATMALWLQREPETQALWSALLDGYRTRRTLAPGDLAALPALRVLLEVRGAGVLARSWSLTPELWPDQHRRLTERVAGLRAAAGQQDASHPG
jgi:Ser/Thr protein kinase RdoA (MazF antagonist)